MPIYRAGGSLKMRLIVAGVLALVAIGSYLAKFEKDELTGEYRALAMKPDEEIRMGIAAAPRMAQQMGGVLDPRTDADARRVRDVGQKLVRAYQTQGNPYFDRFAFHLLNDTRTVNAFALPGGQIFITRALYDRLETEDQLAGVLGHEIGHVRHRHASEHMAKGELGQSLVGAVTVGAGDYTAGQLANMVNQMVQMRYSREDESESDGWGLENMVAAGYDPRAMIRVMQILKEASGGSGGSDIFASHPNPDLRIEQIKAYIAKRWPDVER
jgi:beta-barrel assembly-enhancing protease